MSAMNKIVALFLVVAFVANICPTASEEPDEKWYQATIDLYEHGKEFPVGGIDFMHQGNKTHMQDLHVSGVLWGIEKGKHFGVVYEVNSTCSSPRYPMMTYDDRISGYRPMILFNDMLDGSQRTLGNPVGKASLRAEDPNNIMNHAVLIFPVVWDEFGPLDSYVIHRRFDAVACGVVRLI